MPVPTQSELHLPILETLNEAEGGGEHVITIKDALVERFALTAAELAEVLPSGQIKRFDGRARWAISYLKRAGLIGSPSRSHYMIVPAGKNFLATYEGDTISIRQLKDLIEKRERADSNDQSSETIAVEPDDDITPAEQAESLHKELDAALADDLLDIVKTMPPTNFERLAIDLLVAMRYGEGRQTGASGDQGIDGVIIQDPLGLENVYIQAKRWGENTVGGSAIRDFLGSLDVENANKGVFITTSTFSPSARETASRSGRTIRLIDGRELAKLMIRHNVGVITETTYELKKPDQNYFSEDL